MVSGIGSSGYNRDKLLSFTGLHLSAKSLLSAWRDWSQVTFTAIHTQRKSQYRLRIALARVYRYESLERRWRFEIRYSSKVILLLNSHGDRLYRLLVRLTLREDVAEDLLQDLVVKLSQASGFANAENPYSYARTATVNLAFSWFRGRRREQAIEGTDYPAGDPPPWSSLVKTEEIQRMLDHMGDLSDRDRLILAMRYFDEASYDEIARVFGGTTHQARGLCHKAIGRLRAKMAEPKDGKPETREEVKP